MEPLPADHPLLAYERRYWERGVSRIAGVDEAGRGPLAGPVVAAAVIFDPRFPIPFVNDSKQLSAKRRAKIRDAILETPGVQYAIIEISAAEIDRVNILEASREAMRRAVLGLDRPETALIDGLPVPNFPIASEAIVKGDAKSASVAAASVLAKERRDELMVALAERYPAYGFDRHKGYGTADHLAALREHGPCPEHRVSFAPVRDILDPPPEQLTLF